MRALLLQRTGVHQTDAWTALYLHSRHSIALVLFFQTSCRPDTSVTAFAALPFS
jgi:hypothetical protein